MIKKSAFTLIEIMVVISVISMLSTSINASLNGVRSKARDAKRLSDVNVIKKAMELYKFDNNNEATKEKINLLQYVQGNFPQDPSIDKSYYICASGSDYVIITNLENSNDSGLSSTLSGIDSSNCTLTGPNLSATYPNSLVCGGNVLCSGTNSSLVSSVVSCAPGTYLNPADNTCVNCLTDANCESSQYYCDSSNDCVRRCSGNLYWDRGSCHIVCGHIDGYLSSQCLNGQTCVNNLCETMGIIELPPHKI